MHDVAVGQNQAVRREDESGTVPSLPAAALVVPDLDGDDGRADELDRVNDRLRVRVEDFVFDGFHDGNSEAAQDR